MAFVDNDHVVEAFAPNRADDSFDVWGLPGRARGRDDFLDAHVLDAIAEGLSVDPVAIAEDEPRCLVAGEGLDDLLCGPLSRRVGGDVEVHHGAPIMAKHDEAIQHTERGGRYREEVDRDDVLGMVVQEGSPCLRRRSAMADPVLVDGRSGHVVPEQREFRLNAWCAPKWVLAGHATDQLADLGGDLRSAWLPAARLPSPVQPEALLVPSDDGLGLDDDKYGTPVPHENAIRSSRSREPPDYRSIRFRVTTCWN